MERLTSQIIENINGNKIKTGMVIPKIETNNYQELEKWYQDCAEKLFEYEDLEEQGLLVRLPCKIGDTVYVLTECGCISKQLDGTLYDSGGGFGTATGYYCPYEDSCPHADCEECKNITTIFEDYISGFMIDENEINLFTENCGVGGQLGEYIFLTHEEAEKRLEEMIK